MKALAAVPGTIRAGDVIRKLWPTPRLRAEHHARFGQIRAEPIGAAFSYPTHQHHVTDV